VLNIIPPMKAGAVADMAGVVNVDKNWCAVDFTTYESTVQKNIHVIGDAISAALPNRDTWRLHMQKSALLPSSN